MTGSIYDRMAAILAELPALAKDSVNEQQRFKFRSIDSVLNELNPLLAKHGVFYLPEVLDRTDAERTTRGGGLLFVVNLHVRYTFYATDGSHVTASSWGEGTDAGDKATPKAMTSAMKSCLFQAFAISTEEQTGPDQSSPPESVPRESEPSAVRLARYVRSLAEKEVSEGREALLLDAAESLERMRYQSPEDIRTLLEIPREQKIGEAFEQADLDTLRTWVAVLGDVKQ